MIVAALAFRVAIEFNAAHAATLEVLHTRRTVAAIEAVSLAFGDAVIAAQDRLLAPGPTRDAALLAAQQRLRLRLAVLRALNSGSRTHERSAQLVQFADHRWPTDLVAASTPARALHVSPTIQAFNRTSQAMKLAEMAALERRVGEQEDQRRRALGLMGLLTLLIAAVLAAVVLTLQRDTRRRQVMQQQLLASEERFRQIFVEAPVGMLLIGPRGDILRANRAFCSLLGTDEAALARTPMHELLVADEVVAATHALAELFRGTTAGLQRRQHLVTRSGAVISADINGRLISGDQAQGSYILAVVENSTERCLVEAERQAADERASAMFREVVARNRDVEAVNQHKSRLVATVSHELRTPLNSILGFTHLLLEGQSLTAQQERFLGFIRKGGDDMLRIIGDLLDFSKTEAGVLELGRCDCQVAGVVRDVLAALHPRSQAKRIVTFAAVPETLRIFADPLRFKQILYNLVSNAVKFTPEGGRVEVRASRVKDGLSLLVEDSGVGIRPEDLVAVFEPFHQLDGGGRTEGTGLGLAIARQLVERHGGRIWVESIAGAGSRFHVVLPMADTMAPAA